MTAKEILEETLIVVDTSCFKEGHYFLIEMAMEEYAKLYHESELKKLRVGDVRQQRELLIAYEKYKDGWTDESESDKINFMVDSYLRNL